MTELELLKTIPGLIPDEQGEVLARLASSVNRSDAIVEIGSYKGKSTCYLAYGAGFLGPRVYAVDPWDLPGNPMGKHRYSDPSVRQAFRANVIKMGYEDRITEVQEFSLNAVSRWNEIGSGRRVGMLYIDGDHSAEAVRNDFLAWLPNLAYGRAIIVFDDLDTPKNPGVRVVVDELRDTFRWDYTKNGRLGIFRE